MDNLFNSYKSMAINGPKQFQTFDPDIIRLKDISMEISKNNKLSKKEISSRLGIGPNKVESFFNYCKYFGFLVSENGEKKINDEFKIILEHDEYFENKVSRLILHMNFASRKNGFVTAAYLFHNYLKEHNSIKKKNLFNSIRNIVNDEIASQSTLEKGIDRVINSYMKVPELNSLKLIEKSDEGQYKKGTAIELENEEAELLIYKFWLDNFAEPREISFDQIMAEGGLARYFLWDQDSMDEILSRIDKKIIMYNKIERPAKVKLFPRSDKQLKKSYLDKLIEILS